MRVLLLSANFLPRAVGGGEIQALLLAKRLCACGHEPTILTHEPREGGAIAVEEGSFDGVRVVRLHARGAFTPYARPRKLVAWGQAWLRRERFDVVHVYLWPQLLSLVSAAHAIGCPVVLTALDFGYFCRRYTLLYRNEELCPPETGAATCEQCVFGGYSSRQRAVANLCRAALPPALEALLRDGVRRIFGGDYLPALGGRTMSALIERQRARLSEDLAAVIVPSRFMQEFFRLHGAPADRLHLLPYLIEPAAGGAPRYEPDEGRLRVAFIGRLDPLKGIHVLFEALRRIGPELRVSVDIWSPLTSGPSAYVERLRAAASADPRIQWAGALPREHLGEVYAKIDVLAAPSLWYENAPITIGEALVHGCPVVCTRAEGMTDLVEDGINGLMFPRGDAAALAACLERLAREPALLKRLRRGVRPPRTADSVTADIIALYQRVCARSRMPSR